MSAHYCGRQVVSLGHEARLVPPVFVKALCQEAEVSLNNTQLLICCGRIMWRRICNVVAVKTEAQQAQGMLFRTRDLLARQRTQITNALRDHLAGYGVVAPQSGARIRQLVGGLEDGDCGPPEAVVELSRLLLGQINELEEKIDVLDREFRASARENEETAHQLAIPGIGPVTAMALRLDRINLGRRSSAQPVHTGNHPLDALGLRGYASGFGQGEGPSRRGLHVPC